MDPKEGKVGTTGSLLEATFKEEVGGKLFVLPARKVGLDRLFSCESEIDQLNVG